MRAKNLILNVLKAGAFSFSVTLLLNARVVKNNSAGKLVENPVTRSERVKLLLVLS